MIQTVKVQSYLPTFQGFFMTSNLQGRQSWYIRRKKLHLLGEKPS